MFWEYMNSVNFDQIDFHNIYMKFNSETGQDHGGLSRVLASLIVDELITKYKYLVPTVNQKENINMERDKMIPNDIAVSPTAIKTFTM